MTAMFVRERCTKRWHRADFGVDIDGEGTTVACALPAVTTCAATTTESQCTASGYSYQCQDTTAYGTKCSNFAASCQDIGSGFGCYYPLSDCSAEGVTCANDRATWCDGASKAIFDCGSVCLVCARQRLLDDGTCQCSAPPARGHVAPRRVCDGTKLTFCYVGAPSASIAGLRLTSAKSTITLQDDTTATTGSAK